MVFHPEVSVVMSVYNGAEDLPHSVESILSQQGVGFEFIIVNDGSTDETAMVLDAISDSRLRVIHQDNAGLTKALIRGCSEARGEFIARQDADDISLPDRLRTQLKMLKANDELAMVSCWAECVGPNDEFLFEASPDDETEQATRRLLYGRQGPPAHGSVMFRKSLYFQAGGYRAEFYCAQDNDLWLRMGHLGKYAIVQAPLYRYRVSPVSISGSRRGMAGEYDRLSHLCHEARLKGEDEKPFLNEALQLRKKKYSHSSKFPVHAMAYFIGRCLLANQDHRATGYFWSVILKCPWHMRAWFSLMQSQRLHVVNR